MEVSQEGAGHSSFLVLLIEFVCDSGPQVSGRAAINTEDLG